MAKVFGTDAVVNSSSDLKMNSNSMPGAGLDPTAVAAYSLWRMENALLHS